MDKVLQMALEAVGPRGGNLGNPVSNPERRNAELNVKLTEAGPALHRFEDKAVAGLKNEQPWHRMAAFMLLNGRTNSEIAMAAQKTAQEVSNLRAQRWFQELIAVLGNETGADIVGVLQSEALASIETIVHLRDDSDLPARVRLSAAQTLLEQAHGKPVQKIISNVSHSVHASPQDELDAIQQELAALREKSPALE